MRVLVCGGRDYDGAKRLNEELYRIHKETPITHIIEGGARGADQLAGMWAAVAGGVEHLLFLADWGSYGKAAGAIRNQRMLTEGKPDLVVAFPGGAGTADMVRRAEAAGIKVIKVA